MSDKKLLIKNDLVAFVTALLLFSITSFSSVAQTPLTNTDIFLVPILQTDSGLRLSDARMVTRLKSYDDHPSFSYDSQYMYYTSEGEDYKTDIRAVFIPQFQDVEFVATGGISEYMPQQKPDMKGIALIRADQQNGTRQLWFYGTDASDKNLAPKIAHIESFVWMSDTSVALKLKQNVLCRYNIQTHRLDTLVKNIGPSIGKVPSENAVYYTKNEKGLEHLYRYDIDKKKIDTLLYLPGGATEFAVAVDGSLWAANEGIAYRWPRAAEKWTMMKDFGVGAMGKGYRVAVSRDMKWLAVVTVANY